MLILGHSSFFCFLTHIQINRGLVSGWVVSPFASKKTTKPSIHKKWHQEESLFSISKSRLYQDFTDGDGEGEFFDDFADFDFVVGDDAVISSNNGDGEAEDSFDIQRPEPDSSSPMSVLQQRFKKLSLTEQVNRQQISDNWKEGYWGVWGCSLDPYTEDNAKTKTVVTCIRHMLSPPENDGGDDSALLIVGRSDGSICWLQMENISSSSASSPSSLSASTAPSDNDPKNNVENRSVTTYFENKLVAKATGDGGMIVDKALQRRENNGDSDADIAGGSSPRSPFDILAQIQTASKTPAGSDAAWAIVDMLPLPSARMVWTISHGAPNVIQGWKLVPYSETGLMLPSSGTSMQSSKIDIEIIHTSPIVAMKVIPKSDDDDELNDDSFVVTVSDNGQVVVWEITATMDNESPPSIRIRLDANLLHEQGQEEDYDENDSVLSVDVDDQYLYLGRRTGRISIFSWSAITEEDFETTDAGPLRSLPFVQSFLAFTSKNPGVSTLLAAGPGSLGARNNGSNGNSNNTSNRPPTKSLIAGDMSGGLKQWELIPAGKGRLQYWPRMASQKLPGGKPHVYETRDYSGEDSKEGQNSLFPAIRKLLCIQQVLLAVTDYDLTVWDSSTGKVLYDMQGLDFTLATVGGGSNGDGSHHRPSLISANDSVLITNGMENFVCVHDFAMDRITSENAQDFLERDDGGNGDDYDDF